MRKSVIACVLLLCFLTGCTGIDQAGQPDQPASVLPLVSAFPASDALAVLQATGEQTPSESMLPETAAQTAELDEIFAGSEFSGSVLIARDGEILLKKSYGMADREKGVQNTLGTRFLIGSVTKQFTAMAVMQLYEKGALDLHDTLSKYIPDFTCGGDITLQNLLTQTSGIMDYLNDDPAFLAAIPYDQLSQAKLISLIKTKALKFEPGSKYSYSNSNYLILGYLVEKISGMDYGEYLSQYILEPLGMKNTGLIDVGNLPENLAVSYKNAETPIRYRITADEDGYAKSAASCYGAGGLYSTVEDIYLWDQALSTEKLLSMKYLNMMLEPSVQVPNAENEYAYGFGWVIENDPDVGTVYRHTGVLSGFRAYNGLFADEGVTVIILGNMKEYSGREKITPAVKQVLKTA